MADVRFTDNSDHAISEMREAIQAALEDYKRRTGKEFDTGEKITISQEIGEEYIEV